MKRFFLVLLCLALLKLSTCSNSGGCQRKKPENKLQVPLTKGQTQPFCENTQKLFQALENIRKKILLCQISRPLIKNLTSYDTSEPLQLDCQNSQAQLIWRENSNGSFKDFIITLWDSTSASVTPCLQYEASPDQISLILEGQKILLWQKGNVIGVENQSCQLSDQLESQILPQIPQLAVEYDPAQQSWHFFMISDQHNILTLARCFSSAPKLSSESNGNKSIDLDPKTP